MAVGWLTSLTVSSYSSNCAVYLMLSSDSIHFVSDLHFIIHSFIYLFHHWLWNDSVFRFRWSNNNDSQSVARAFQFNINWSVLFVLVRLWPDTTFMSSRWLHLHSSLFDWQLRFFSFVIIFCFFPVFGILLKPFTSILFFQKNRVSSN